MMRLSHRLVLPQNKAGIVGGGDGEAYGVRFRESGSSYAYERAGVLAGIPASTALSDEYLPIQRLMRRCVLGTDGVVSYYLDSENSMWRDGSTSGASMNVVDIFVPRSEAAAWVELDKEADPRNIGCIIKLEDGKGSREWYALIIGTDGYRYYIANPLLIGWGYDAGGGLCDSAVIGDAKLGGQDGQFMVEIPGFWHRHKWERDAAGIWQRHDISLSRFPGAKYIPKHYHGAVEGVGGDSSGLPVDGWNGIWDEANGVWNGIAYAALGSNMQSVVGYYPRTYFYRENARIMAGAVGDAYHQLGFQNNFALQVLMITEFAKMNTQTAIGTGIASFPSSDGGWAAYNGSRPIRRTGDTIRSGNHTWDMSTLGALARMPVQGGGTYNVQSISYRGIENPFGHIFKWVDGINFQWEEPEDGIAFAYPYVTDNPSLFADTIDPGYVQLPDRMESALLEGGTWTAKPRYWKDPSPHLLPTKISATATGYTGDYVNYPAGAPAKGSLYVLAVGGLAAHGASVGAFFVDSAYGSRSRYAYFGGRLCAKYLHKKKYDGK